MPSLKWDQSGTRKYESGLDRGVLYLPDGTAVPWNGLVSVSEKSNKSSSPIYFEGVKISDLVSVGEYSGTLTALTYPDEFVELEGSEDYRSGIHLTRQPPGFFGLSYRSRIGNDVEGQVAGYKIHLLYNCTAVPSDRSSQTIGNDVTLANFEWDISAIPEDFPGFRPTAHVVLDSTEIDPLLMAEIEEVLYGNERNDASQISLVDLATRITNFYRIKITDNGDGTWTAESKRAGWIGFEDTNIFYIIHANAVYLDDNTYVIDDTRTLSDIPEIVVTDDGDGFWSAIANRDDLIFFDEDGGFTIFDANAVFTYPEGG